jgi:hypothetical protein
MATMQPPSMARDERRARGVPPDPAREAIWDNPDARRADETNPHRGHARRRAYRQQFGYEPDGLQLAAFVQGIV